MRATWFRPPATIAELNTNLQQFASAGITDLYIETFYHGLTLSAAGEFNRRYLFDYLAQAIPAAAKVGIRLHAWIESAYWQYSTSGDNYLFLANPSWKVINRATGATGGDQAGQTFVNLTIPAVQTKLRNYCAQLAAYPGLWSVQTDYHRFPLDNSTGDSYPTPWSYETTSSNAFKAIYGAGVDINTQASQTGQPYYNTYVSWRKAQITEAANQMSLGVGGVNTDVDFSAAMFPIPETAKCQDWTTWGTGNIVDHFVPMCYRSTTTAIKNDLNITLASAGGKPVTAGLATGSLSLSSQLTACKEVGVEDFSIWVGTWFATAANRAELKNWITANATKMRADLNLNNVLEAADWQAFTANYQGTPISSSGLTQMNYDGNGVIDTADHNRFRAMLRKYFLGPTGVLQPSDWTAFNLTFTGPGSGTAGPYVCLYDIDRDGDVDSDDQDLLTLIGSTTPMAFTTVAVQDSVVPNSPRPITFEWRDPSTDAVVLTWTAETDALNRAMIPTPAPGTYDLRIKGSHWLAKRIQNVVVGASDIPNLSVSLINGDCDGDNLTTTDDYLVFSLAFDTVEGDPAFNPNADLDESGAVTTDDYLIFSQNFDLEGE